MLEWDPDVGMGLELASTTAFALSGLPSTPSDTWLALLPPSLARQGGYEANLQHVTSVLVEEQEEEGCGVLISVG